MMVWHNGEWKGEEELLIPLDEGFLRGFGLFETMAAEAGRVIFWQRHWQRLAESSASLGLPSISRKSFEKITHEILQINSFNAEQRVRLRVTVSAASILVTAHLDTPRSVPCHVVLSPFVRNERDALAGHKSTAYAGNLLALQHGKARGADEVLLANTKGEWCEGTWSNLFAVEDRVLLTPPLSSGCLPGVTRGVVLELAPQLGLLVRQEARPLTWLSTARELFLTSRLAGVLPVASLESHSLAPGDETKNLVKALALAEKSD